MEVAIQHNIINTFVLNNIDIFKHQKSFKIISFNIILYLVNHLTYDAYIF